MKLTVFGATGGIGRHLVTQSLAAGHHVTAVVRDPARLDLGPGPHLDVVIADVMNPEAILTAVMGRDAVASALGPRKGGPMTVCSDGVRSIVEAMRVAGVARLVVVSASGHVIDAGDGLLTAKVVKPILGRMLREGFADLKRMEAVITASGLDWTVIRPPRLTNGPLTPYRTATDLNVRGGITMSRASVAHAMLTVLGDPATIRHTIGAGR